MHATDGRYVKQSIRLKFQVSYLHPRMARSTIWVYGAIYAAGGFISNNFSERLRRICGICLITNIVKVIKINWFRQMLILIQDILRLSQYFISKQKYLPSRFLRFFQKRNTKLRIKMVLQSNQSWTIEKKKYYNKIKVEQL